MPANLKCQFVLAVGLIVLEAFISHFDPLFEYSKNRFRRLILLKQTFLENLTLPLSLERQN